MPKRISRKTALIECMNHWEWVYKHENPNVLQADYPLPKEVINSDNCWCCYYVDHGLHRQEKTCDICPLKGIAWERSCCKEPTLYLSPFEKESYQDVGYRLMWACYVALNEKYPSEYPLDFSESSYE